MQKDPEYKKLKVFAGANFFYGNKKNNKLSVFLNRTSQKGDAGRVYRGFNYNYTTVNIAQSTELSKNLNFHTSVGIRIYDRSWQESIYTTIDSLVSNNGVIQNIIPVDANLTWKHGKNNLLTIGTDYQNAEYYTTTDPLVGYDQYGNKSRAFQSGIYVQEELNFGDLTARAGLRYNYIQTNIELIGGGSPGDPETNYSNLLWSAGLKYRVLSVLTIYANAGNSFLPPGLKSMGGTIALSDQGVPNMNGQLPNPDLKPESGIAADLGVDLTLFENMSLSARGFMMMVDDAIIDIRVSETPSQSQSVNAGKSNSSGFEIEASQQLNSSFSWFVNYTYMNTSIENDKDSDQDGANVPFAPEHIANAGLTLETKFGLMFRPVLNYNSGYYDSSSKSGRKKFTPGALINLYASQLLVENDTYSFNLFATVYNLTNNKYEMPWQFQNTGLAINGGIRIQFR
jgi:outer membrane receptor protein involved in Fe transport